MLEHAAFIFTRPPVHRDGKTSFEKKSGRPWRGKLLEFGEGCLAKMVKPKSRSKMAKKVQAKFVRATWMGITERTGEHRVVSRGGKAFRVSTVRRVPIKTRWNRETWMGIATIPRHPDPARATHAKDAEVKHVADMHEDLAPEAENKKKDGAAQAAEITMKLDDVREMRISKTLVTKFGASE